MNAFESLVASLLELDGYWVKPTFRVALTKEDKRRIGRPSSPRWELDLVAYKGASNEVLVVECKSYLDSQGVRADGFMGNDKSHLAKYKLFNDEVLRDTVLARLSKQLVEAGLCADDPKIRLCLAAGKIATEGDRRRLQGHFTSSKWHLFDDTWLREKLKEVSDSGYENQVSAIVAKLLLRGNDSV
jgi:hypothetical protein